MNFNEQQFKVIRVLQDGIIPPSNDAPAASDLPVAEIFASIAASWDSDTFNKTATALDIINGISLSFYNQNIWDLSADNLQTLTNVIAENEDLRPFWVPFRILTTLNYYGLPAAYQAIGLPGPTIDQGGLTPEGYPV
ncbi:hypothetical protein tinsulaeT_10820 [Thalassotalea insulae]|uniref:Gluconate 2-dehydrogenase subunit 3 family protein n=1 Tax=Thalassotalea insulae TaxID=2056778 RepID=A0ABQ6GP80_9GAMM|nr:gluconate 2-dehydrogenase subunit 3 family protein [Thalassotalea insulae]GLX77742.1 hypothetical protein tinsulaeT_10820 [Thalassotalea insulae]